MYNVCCDDTARRLLIVLREVLVVVVPVPVVTVLLVGITSWLYYRLFYRYFYYQWKTLIVLVPNECGSSTSTFNYIVLVR
jgi:hypothetical protein